MSIIPKIVRGRGGLNSDLLINGLSYKHLTLVNYDSRVVVTSKLLILATIESYFMNVEAL